VGLDLVQISLVDYALVIHNLAKAIGNKECKEVEIVLLGRHDYHFFREKVQADAGLYGMYGYVAFAILE
jgi:hypothetical protein